MAHFEDYELAQGIHRELLELRARANSATSVELSVIAAKAELPTNWQPQERLPGLPSRGFSLSRSAERWLSVDRPVMCLASTFPGRPISVRFHGFAMDALT